MTTSFGIWFFRKDHKYHRLAMIIFYLHSGIFFTLVGILGLNISEFFAFTFIFSLISFGSGFYYLVEKKEKREKNSTEWTLRIVSNSS